MTAYSIGASSNMPELTVSPATMKKATTFQATRGLTQSRRTKHARERTTAVNASIRMVRDESVSLTTNPTASPYSKVRQTLITTPSDSDFTPLAIRLRESGLYIIGAGVTTTPESFKNACDDFILIDYLSKADEKPAAAEHAAEPAAKKPARKTKKTTRSTKKPAAEAAPSAEPEPTPEPEPEPEPKKPNIGEIHNLLHIASEKYQDADGFVNVSSSGLYIKRVKPDFNVRAYGYSKLPELLAAFPNKYQIKRYEGKGGATIIAYKCL